LPPPSADTPKPASSTARSRSGGTGPSPARQFRATYSVPPDDEIRALVDLVDRVPPEYRFADLLDDAEWVRDRLFAAICDLDDADYAYTRAEDRCMRGDLPAHALAEVEARLDLAHRRYE